MNEILIYADIGEGFFSEGITAATIKKQLDSFDGEVLVRINSAGGDAFEGLAIYNLLNEREGVTVKFDGLAASSASVIAMAGDTIHMAENALMMIHDPWSMAMGGAEDMRKTAEVLDKVKDAIVSTYTQQSSMEAEAINAMMASETWMNADEAIINGFATDLTEGGEVYNALNKAWIRNEPPKEKFNDDGWRIALNRRRLSLIQ